jgi:hypothetical protein
MKTLNQQGIQENDGICGILIGLDSLAFMLDYTVRTCTALESNRLANLFYHSITIINTWIF